MKVGLVLKIVHNKEFGRAPSYDEIRATAISAEQSGFDSLWLYDHFLYRVEGEPTIGIWECWTILSALAEATQRVELGTLVACTQYRNPAVLAKMAVTLDEVSHGRLILGLGAGWNKAEFDAFGIAYDHRAARFEEAVQIIKPLLREGYVDFEGKYYQAKNCEITPQGSRKNGPPLLLAGERPRMLRLVAQYADMWNTGYLGLPATLKEPKTRMETACDQVGRDPGSLPITGLTALVYTDLTDEPTSFENGYLSGSTQEIVAALHEYKTLGLSHIMFHVVPYNPTAIARLIEAVQLFQVMQ